MSCRSVRQILVLQLAGVDNLDLRLWLAGWGTVAFDGLQGLATFNQLTKNNVMAVQPWTWDSGDEELGAVGVWAGIRHRKLTRLGVLDVEVLVLELVAVDGLTAVAVEVGDVTTLDHEPWNDSVEDGVFVAKALFARAQGSEVLSGLWNLLVKQVKHHSWLLGTANGDVEVHLR